MVDRHERLQDALSQSFPDLTFWYGLSPDELVRLPRWLLNVYIRELPRLLAESEAMMMKAASFPHLKKSGQNQARSDINRRLKSRARSRNRNAVKPKTREELATNAAGVGIGIRRA